MAGGMAFGSTFGALFEPLVGWRGVFLGVGAFGGCVLVLLLPYRHLLGDASRTSSPLSAVLAGYRTLLGSERGRRTYAYVLVNAVFHSGVFTWLGVYFSRRYGLGEIGIGLALVGYGVPGFVLGPLIGRAADRWGRRWLVPSGLAIGGVAAVALVPDVPLVLAALAVTVLSLGYDMTQPLLAGIVTALAGRRGGQAMGLNVFTLFTGFGLGSLLFGEALRLGIGPALAVFAAVQLAAAVAAVPFFRAGRSARRRGRRPCEVAFPPMGLSGGRTRTFEKRIGYAGPTRRPAGRFARYGIGTLADTVEGCAVNLAFSALALLVDLASLGVAGLRTPRIPQRPTVGTSPTPVDAKQARDVG